MSRVWKIHQGLRLGCTHSSSIGERKKHTNLRKMDTILTDDGSILTIEVSGVLSSMRCTKARVGGRRMGMKREDRVPAGSSTDDSS